MLSLFLSPGMSEHLFAVDRCKQMLSTNNALAAFYRYLPIYKALLRDNVRAVYQVRETERERPQVLGQLALYT